MLFSCLLLAGAGAAEQPQPASSVSTNLAADASPPEIPLPKNFTTTPAPFPGSGWKSMFDDKTLSGWKLTDFAGHGDVNCRAGAVIMGFGEPLTGITWTNPFPHMNYELAFDAMRVSGSDFFCGLTVPVMTNYCTLIVGGWGGSIVGISSLDDMDASENETTKFENFENGRWYRIRLRVTPDRIEGWLDQEKYIDVVTKDKKISLRPGEIEMSTPFGIAAYECASALRRIQWREVSGPADPVKKKRKRDVGYPP